MSIKLVNSLNLWGGGDAFLKFYQLFTKFQLFLGIIVSNLFANHITFDNGYMKCAHKKNYNS